MKTAAAFTPPPPASSTIPPATSPRDRSEARRGGGGAGGSGDSCYFPGCRKDANCHCEICLASIHATRDLVPSGAASSIQLQKSSLTKLSVSKPRRAAQAPVPFDAPLTPEATGSTVTPPSTPPVYPPARSRLTEKVSIKKQPSWSLDRSVIGVLVGLILVWAADSGFSAVILRDFGPRLTPDLVSGAGEESRVRGSDLNEKLELLQQRIEDLVSTRVSNCSSIDSIWGMNQGDQFLFQWRCVMHKSIAERVSVWGTPLRTTGLLAAGASPRSMTLLSGKIIEWSDGKLQSTTRTSNGSSWTYEKWSSAAMHLEADTWILEYERSALIQGPRLIPAAWEALSLKVSKKVKDLRQKIRCRRLRGSQCNRRRGQRVATTPT